MKLSRGLSQSLGPSLPVDVFVSDVFVRSEQATMHSAPSPFAFPFDLKVRVSLLALELKFIGPLFWQNLEIHDISLFGGSRVEWEKNLSNLCFPRERKSPFLPLQFALGCATWNFGQDTTSDGQEVLFCKNASLCKNVKKMRFNTQNQNWPWSELCIWYSVHTSCQLVWRREHSNLIQYAQSGKYLVFCTVISCWLFIYEGIKFWPGPLEISQGGRQYLTILI